MTTPVDYSEYDVDLFALAESRRLGDFNQACTMAGILTVETREAQECHNAILEVLSGRSLSEARGEQLNIIGELVGAERVLRNQAEINWFTPDRLGSGSDSEARAWLEGVALAGDLPADDVQYLTIIQAKIFKNHSKHGSIPELIQFVRILYNINVSFRKVGNADLLLIIPVNTPAGIVTTLLSEVNDDLADHQYFLPIPTGTRLLPNAESRQTYFMTDSFINTVDGPSVAFVTGA